MFLGVVHCGSRIKTHLWPFQLFDLSIVPSPNLQVQGPADRVPPPATASAAARAPLQRPPSFNQHSSTAPQPHFPPHGPATLCRDCSIFYTPISSQSPHLQHPQFASRLFRTPAPPVATATCPHPTTRQRRTGEPIFPLGLGTMWPWNHVALKPYGLGTIWALERYGNHMALEPSVTKANVSAHDQRPPSSPHR